MDYAVVKLVHQSAVVLTIAGFFARGIASFLGAQWVRRRPARIVPHVVDTVLLVSALAMLWMLRMGPLDAPWLVAKILGLMAYIALGIVALRPGVPISVRVGAWIAALVTVAWMVSVAVTKHPTGFLGAFA